MIKLTKVDPTEAKNSKQSDIGHYIGSIDLLDLSIPEKDQITEILGFEPIDYSNDDNPNPKYKYDWWFKDENETYGSIYTSYDEIHYTGPTELITKIIRDSGKKAIIREWCKAPIHIF